MPMHQQLAATMGALLLAAVAQASAAEQVRSSVPPLLAANDTNRDGKLTLDELDAARERQVARFDADANGSLDVEEYGALWLDSLRERMLRQFHVDDRDHDGAVTIDELKQRAADLVRRRDLDRDGALTAEELRPRARTRQASATPARAANIGASSTAVE